MLSHVEGLSRRELITWALWVEGVVPFAVPVVAGEDAGVLEFVHLAFRGS